MIQIIACNERDCPWHSVTMVGNMSECGNPDAPNSRVARKMEMGAPDLCPVKTKGPYFMVVTSEGPLVIESARKMFSEWKALWKSQLDKAL